MEEIQLKSSDEHASDTVTLRPLDLSDVDDVMVWRSDDKVSKFCSWNTLTRKEDVINYLIDSVFPHPWFRAICLNGRPVGAISVKPNVGSDSCRAELGYVIGSKYWGKGIATKAVKMVVSAIFVEWPHLERLEALVDDENKGSQRVLDKAGFQREGLLRKYYLRKGKPSDMVIFSLLSTDPQANLFYL